MTSVLKPYIVRDLLEDEDVFGYIKIGSHADAYDRQAQYINERLSNDLSIDQIEKIIWEACYAELCVCDKVSMSKKEALPIIGEPSRFAHIAKEIRKQIKF